MAPRDTLQRLRPGLATMGITRVADLTGLDRIGIPVFAAYRPNSRALAVAQGKGLDADAARVSAIMESVESFHAERMQLPLVQASWRELSARARVVDAARLMPSVHGGFHPDLQLLWVEGRDLLAGDAIWVPYQVVHTNYTRLFLQEPNCFLASSTGLASGNHAVEATSHAICEVVERDATQRFRQLDPDARQQRRLDLDSVDDPDCLDVLARLASARMAVAAWDITGPVGLPTFECLIADQDPHDWPQMPASGFGCHPVRGIALLRAVTEAVQSRLTLISGARDDISRAQIDRVTNDANVVAMRALALLPGQQRWHSVPSFELDTFEYDLALELALLRRAGIEQVAVVDVSPQAVGYSVVRVVIPGQRQRWTD